MPEFEGMFWDAENQIIEYNGRTLIRADQLGVKAGDTLRLVFEGTNSEWRQGVMLKIGKKGAMYLEEERYTVPLVFWADTAPPEVIVGIESKQPNVVTLYNIWDSGNGAIDGLHNGAAMTVEVCDQVRRYSCNDGHPDDNFDDVIFSITIERG